MTDLEARRMRYKRRVHVSVVAERMKGADAERVKGVGLSRMEGIDAERLLGIDAEFM
jgi:hypothetical protein